MADGIPPRKSTRFSRRTAIVVPIALLTTPASKRSGSLAGQPTGSPDADCTEAPGVQLLIDLGRNLPVMSALDLAIPAGWGAYFDQQMGLAFYHPADWGVVRLWADRLSAGGAPEWVTQPTAAPIIVSARAVAPAGNAAFEMAVANLPNVAVAPRQLSNSPSFTPPTKASHSERVKNSFGPSGFLESRNT